MILRAGVWFTSAGLPVYEWKGNPERMVINLWHGIPLKKSSADGGETKLFAPILF